jgi:protein-tyrosine phosphatase
MRFHTRLIERVLTSPTGGFAPATPDEPTVYGARRPGFPLRAASPEAVQRWIAAMRAAGVRRVVCLLPPPQLTGYDGLLERYGEAFGAGAVCWAPIADFHLAEPTTLIGQILPALFAADAAGERVVVHCSAGIGRTGHVLAAWLVSARGMTNEAAIAAVRRSGRNAREAGDPGLDALLDACRAAFAPERPQG